MPSPSPDDLIPLPQLIRELRASADVLGLDHGALNGATYDQARRAVLNGVLPAEKTGREWKVRRGDLKSAAVALGLQAARTPGRPRKASALSSNAAVAA